MTRSGLIGLGEAGSAIAAGLAEQSAAGIVGFDVRPDAPSARAAERAGVRMAGSASAVVAACDVVLCLTQADAAVTAARDAAAALTPDHLYADLNSASPKLKQAVAEVVEQAGTRFVDGAVMAAVLPRRHRVPILASGSGAAAFRGAVTPLGMDVEVLGARAGQASAVKMYRSLLVKGLEALVFECALGAERYGATERVFASMAASLPFDDWSELASYLMGRTVAHGARRAEELRQVADTLESSGIDAMLARAAAARLQWAADRLPPERARDGPLTGYRAIIAALGDGED
jgi:3-hydroxyisobutyrate dehydrogenase-like beta-hydroxyacid dehydrogenase